MDDYLKRIKEPVKRQGAENSLLIMLISFAGSVILTRLYLSIFNYPTIGGESFHIAHVLWGGLLLFAAVLLPLIFTNRWIYPLSAFLAGTGVGFFIDEVGKFITTTNDYFFQPAATIIYAFFLLTVLIFLQVKKPRRHDSRTELFHALDVLEEFLDNDLDKDEYEDVIERLEKISKETSHPDRAELARSMLIFFKSRHLKIEEDKPSLYELAEAKIQTFERKFIKQRIFKTLITISVALLGFSAIGNIAILLNVAISDEYFQEILKELLSEQAITGTYLVLFITRLFLESVVGILFFIATYFWILQRDRRAIMFTLLGLLVSLTTINLLAFYFDQFRAVIGSLIELFILLAVLRYREIFLNPKVKHLKK